MVKVLISVDAKLLQRIDRRAKSSGLSRSAYIARIAEQNEFLTSGRNTASARRALGRLDRLFGKNRSGEATAQVRAERDAR